MQSGKNNYRRAVIAIAKFEHAMRNVSRLVCQNCHTWCLVTNYKTDYVCNRCKTNKYDQSHFLNENYQPIWYDDNNGIRWDVPVELSGLTTQEELVIQRNTPYVPIIHLHQGSLGLKGHCIVFEQELYGDINQLPQLQSNIVHFNQQYGSCVTRKKQKQMFIKIRQQKVIDGLKS